MSLLFRIIFAHECTSTHHKLAMDALRFLDDVDAERWRSLFVKHFDAYLDGSKAPDNKFKDFRNHVLHVRDNYWGGAIAKANEWYANTVRELRQKNWRGGIYAAGVLSHYFTDPFQPFHTAQSEAEGAVHRAAEWSIAKSYGELQNILVEDYGGYPEFDAPETATWLGEMIRRGALLANQYYDLLIDHYDLPRGVKNPPAGFDQECKDILAQLVGQAVVGFANVLDRAFDEADVFPPAVNPTVSTFLTSLTIPITWVEKKLADSADRAAVRRIYNEVQKSGHVIKSLPKDDREVRALHAEEVLKVPLDELDKQTPRAAGTQHGQGEPPRPRSGKLMTKVVPPPVDTNKDEEDESTGDKRPGDSSHGSPAAPATTPRRFYLNPSNDVVDAPSIGPKTANRLYKIGVKTVADLLALDPADAVKLLGARHIDADTIGQWQAQAALVCRIPNLRGHDAQLLVACEITEPDEVALSAADKLLSDITEFARSKPGQRLLGRSSLPDLAEVTEWIEWAGDSRPLKAA